MVIIICSTFFMLVTTQFVIMLEDSKNYGIMYAVGFSEKEVKHMLLMKHIITFILALVIAIPSCIWIAGKWFATSDMKYMIHTILLQNVVPSALVFIVVLLSLLHIVTGLFLKKMTPNTLIRCRL
jgi:ABC-type antimicrobial peptide transport system permease subunit